MLRICVLIAIGACTGPESYGDPVDDPQVPARGFDAIQDWISAGYYLAWHCEPEPHPRRSPSPHGAMNRICSNDALAAASGTGPFPVSAAAVKEVYGSSGGIVGYAVYRKVSDRGGGDSWYWYEGSRDDVAANGEGESSCTGCHGAAPRDYVFTVVP
jgi:hypothetical protein